MRTITAFITMAIGLLGLGPATAAAAPQGPFCFTTLPFSDVFVFFFESSGGNQFIATGRDLLTNSAMSATLFVTGNVGVLSFVAPASPGGHSAMGTANLDLATGSGSAVCETVNSFQGCGSGASFTMALAACPPDALSSPEGMPAAGSAGPMGGTR